MSDDIRPPVPIEQMRTASTTALFGPLIAKAGTLARGIEAQVRIEEAEVRLRALTRPAHHAEVLAEVDRRGDVYAKAWRERPEPWPHGETPRLAALRTVADDVARGRLG